MAIALHARTKLSLTEWARIIGINPIHFEGVQLTGNPSGPRMQRVACDAAWFQDNWQQADRVSREEVALAIARAEADIEAFLGYHILPDWDVDEWHSVDRPHRPELIHLGQLNLRGFQPSVRLDNRYFIAGGRRAVSLIDDNAAIVWSDADSDGYSETGTITVATTVDACEIRLFYPGHDAEPEYEIRPINVSISGANATITFRREQAVSETLLFAFPDNDGQYPTADGLDDADFLAVADVYRVYNDPQSQATIMWEQPAPGGCGCTACSFGTQTACLHTRGDRELSHVAWAAAEWDADTSQFIYRNLAVCRAPDILRTSYLSGYQDSRVDCPRKTLSQDWARIVAYYAASMLERPLCDCSAEVFEYWRADIAVVGGAGTDVAYAGGQGQLNNPFGTRRGAIFAWQRLQRPGAIMTGSVVA